MSEHRPLRERESIFRHDVNDAIRSLVGDRDNLPVAFEIVAIADELVQLVHKGDDGLIAEIAPMVRRTMVDAYMQRLVGSALFKNGYKQFEASSGYPVVPTTAFFFDYLYSDDTRQCLDAMNELEIQQSLPRPINRVRDSSNSQFITNPDGSFFVCGEVAGIVIFPPNSRASLLTSWLRQRATSAIGGVASAVAALEHARPEHQAVVTLSQYARDLPRNMRRALPRPREGS